MEENTKIFLELEEIEARTQTQANNQSSRISDRSREPPDLIEKVNDQLSQTSDQSSETSDESCELLEDIETTHEQSQSPEVEATKGLDVPYSTPLLEESSRNVHIEINPSQEINCSNQNNPIIESSNPVGNDEPRYPQRANKGIPRKQYVPDPRAKAKYPISNYVSTHKLSESYTLTVNQLSFVAIPRKHQEIQGGRKQ